MTTKLRRLFFHSLAFKLAAAFLLVGITGALLVAVISWRRTQAAFNQFILNQEQMLLVNSLQRYYQNRGGWDGLSNNFATLWIERNVLENRRLPRRSWERFIVLNLDQNVVYNSRPDKEGVVLTPNQIENAYPLQVEERVVGYLILDPLPQEWIRDSAEETFLSRVSKATLLGALMATGLAIAIGGLLAVTMTRSLRELTEATMEIAKGHLGKQVKVRSKDELGELAHSFNQMSIDLARATQARQQMTADIAHDLRSPLSVITGYAEALSDGKLPGTPEVYAILHQETQHLSHLIDDLRTLSLADAGELPLTLQAVKPHILLEQLAVRHTVAASQKKILLRVQAESNLPDLQVDVERMAQVLDNLLLNAFRYTPEQGQITLSAFALSKGVEIQVRDNGIGIAEADLPYIFDRFYRGDASRPQNGESGLGLAIAKSIVEAHGGTIRAESVSGHGATFTISFPSHSKAPAL